MSICIRTLIKRLRKIDARRFSTAVDVKEIQDDPITTFRTLESDPTKHNKSHLNRFYTIPNPVVQKLFENGGIPNEVKKQIKAFTEYCILVRKPAVELISYLNQTDYTRPVNKYVLYGVLGAGKTTTLAHILHYAYLKECVIVHFPWINSCLRFPKEVATSPLNPDLLDLPVDMGKWLRYFEQQNASLLQKLDLRVSKDYEWNHRETTKAGDPILSMTDFGIKRIKYSCGVIDALFNELKIASTAGKCRTLVAVDGFNAFTSTHTSVRDDNKMFVPAEKLSITKAIMNIVNYDWCNGAVVLTLDKRATKESRDSDLPRYLLGDEGFEYLDPFLPIAVENYTHDEFESVMDYYLDRKWVLDITPKGRKELELVSNRNGHRLINCCAPL